MRIYFKTRVKGNFKTVFKDFDRELFEFLKPKLGKVQIVEFGGSKVGSKVHVRFLSPIKADWISEITEVNQSQSELFFIDQGISLPPGMKNWHHKHSVRFVSENESEVIDDINYQGNNFILSVLLYPALLAGFLPRKWQYKSFFNNRNK